MILNPIHTIMNWFYKTTIFLAISANVFAKDVPVCDSGYASFDKRICYKIYSTPLNRTDAVARCRYDGGYLASVPSAFDNSYIVSQFLNNTSGKGAWLGITCNNSVASCKNDDGTRFGPYQNFVPGQSFGSHQCVYTKTRAWYANADCSIEMPFMCEIPIGEFCPRGYESFNGDCYRWVKEELPTMEADMICEKDNAHLVSIHSGDENEYLIQLALSSSNASDNNVLRIGLYFDNIQQHNWFDNTPFDWDRIAMDNVDYTNCYAMGLVESIVVPKGFWYRNLCDTSMPYACKIAKNINNTTPQTKENVYRNIADGKVEKEVLLQPSSDEPKNVAFKRTRLQL